MITYPKVEHKIPELFQIIIKIDRVLAAMQSLSVISFSTLKRREKLLERRQELATAAEKFIQRQKGGNNA